MSVSSPPPIDIDELALRLGLIEPNKAMVTIDIPPNCVQCPLGVSNAVYSGIVCRATNPPTSFYEAYGEQHHRADFCPLQLIYEKR